MSDAAPPPAAEKPAEITRSRRLALAFESVFGQDVRRSADQRLVLAHLRERCGRDTPVFTADSIGAFDPLRAAHKDGAQTQYLIINRQLAAAAKVRLAEKPAKRTVKR